MLSGRPKILLALAWLLVGATGASPVRSQEAGHGIAHGGPGRGELAGFVATPQRQAAGNLALLIAPNGRWFLATSPHAPGARLIEMRHGNTLRFLTRPGLHIAGLAISPDSRTVFARDFDGAIVAWDAATGDVLASPPPAEFHDIARLSFVYDGHDGEAVATAELLARYRLRSPELEKLDDIALNPTRHYAIVDRVGDPDWKAFRIFDLTQEKAEILFRLDHVDCGFRPYGFDYDGKHLVLGNTRGEGDSNHLDIAIFEIDHGGTDGGPNTVKARTIVAKCAFPPGFDVGRALIFAISPGAGLISGVAFMPGSPEWAAWDLRTGRKVASIRPDGYGIVSADDKTIAVLHAPEHAGARSVQRMTVMRGGRQKNFAIPQSMQSDDWRPVVLSANGRWIASRVNDVVAVWSSEDGKLLTEYRVPQGRISDILRVSDSGDPLLANDDDGTVLVNGQWRPARSDQDGLLVPLTPDFQAQCGVIFCDRVASELGVVERKPRDPDRFVTRQDLSPDGRFMVVRLDLAKQGAYEGTDILDVADGRIVMHVDQDQLQFTPDSRFIVAWDRDVGSFVKYELATARRVWTTFPNPIRGGFTTLLPDGRLRTSSRRSADVLLVRGFETRPFDAAAARQFFAPDER